MNLKEAKRVRRKNRVMAQMQRYRQRHEPQAAPQPTTANPFEHSMFEIKSTPFNTTTPTMSVPSVWIKEPTTLWERLKSFFGF